MISVQICGAWVHTQQLTMHTLRSVDSNKRKVTSPLTGFADIFAYLFSLIWRDSQEYTTTADLHINLFLRGN